MRFSNNVATEKPLDSRFNCFIATPVPKPRSPETDKRGVAGGCLRNQRGDAPRRDSKLRPRSRDRRLLRVPTQVIFVTRGIIECGNL